MSLSLYQAYQKLHRFTSASLVKVDDINQLLETLAAEIRTAYETNLPGITPSQLRAHREAKNKRQQGGDAAANQQQNTPLENSIDRAKTHCELSLLLATAPPPNLHAVVLNFFNKHLREYRAQVDPAKLFFADYSLLEIEDDEATLRRRRLPPRPYVDVFKRCVLSAERRLAQAEEEGVEDPQWRRCARCTAVMGDIYSLHAGYTFVVGQQRKCSCGGCWGMLEKGKMVS
jgi:mediator of RNA polymerase II transcription subunit 16